MTDLGRTPPFTAAVQPTKVQSARRWNGGLIAMGIVIIGLSAAGVIALLVTRFGSGVTLILAAILGLAAILQVWAAIGRTRMRRLLAPPGAGTALSVDEAGITTPGTGLLAWSDVVFLSVTNDRPRTGALRRIPIIGWFGMAGVRAGSGTILLEVAVRDGVALRARMSDRGAAGRVSLHGRAQGARLGLVPLLLDIVLSEPDTQEAVRVLFAHAVARGIPHALHESVVASTRWKLPYLSPELRSR